MAENELTYIIPLRRNWLKVARYKRGQNAINTIRSFLKRHTKIDEIKIGKYLNEYVLARGFRHPPHKVQVKILKEKAKVKDKEIDVVRAEWINAPVEKKEEIKKVEEKKVEEKKDKEEKLEVKEKTEKEEKKKVLEHAKLEKHERAFEKEKTQTKKQMEKARKETIVTATGKR